MPHARFTWLADQKLHQIFVSDGPVVREDLERTARLLRVPPVSTRETDGWTDIADGRGGRYMWRVGEVSSPPPDPGPPAGKHAWDYRLVYRLADRNDPREAGATFVVVDIYGIDELHTLLSTGR